MDSLMETIDEIKTLIPDAKYMELMAACSKIHKQPKRTTQFKLSEIKQLITFLQSSAMSDNTKYFMNMRGGQYSMIIQTVEENDEQLIETLKKISSQHLREIDTYGEPREVVSVIKFNPDIFGHPMMMGEDTECLYDNFTVGEQPMNYNGTRPERKMVSLYFGWKHYEFNEDEGTALMENVSNIGKKVLLMMAQTVMNEFL